MLTQEIETKIIEFFNKAVANPENIDADEDGGINWNFVDADVAIDVKAAGLDVDDVDLFNFVEELISEYFGE